MNATSWYRVYLLMLRSNCSDDALTALRPRSGQAETRLPSASPWQALSTPFDSAAQDRQRKAFSWFSMWPLERPRTTAQEASGSKPRRPPLPRGVAPQCAAAFVITIFCGAHVFQSKAGQHGTGVGQGLSETGCRTPAIGVVSIGFLPLNLKNLRVVYDHGRATTNGLEMKAESCSGGYE